VEGAALNWFFAEDDRDTGAKVSNYAQTKLPIMVLV
jgi:hypothetical protein